MKHCKFILFIVCLCCTIHSNAQTRIQIANNCPDNAFLGIDVYLNGALFQSNIGYRTATAFLDIPPGNHTISVAPENSTSVTSAFYTTTLLLAPQDTIVAVANGTNTVVGYTPHKPFTLNVFFGAREFAYDPNNFETLFVNGITDIGKIDFRSGLDTWINDLDFGGITGYNEFINGNSYTFRITNATGGNAFQTYDFTPQPGWVGSSGIVMTSGFLSPANNNNGPAFETMIVLSTGGPFFPLTHANPELYARVQLIHSSADTLADTVDVYINNDLILDDVSFLTATSFLDAPAKIPLDIGIARMNSLSSFDTFYNLNITFDSAGKYILASYGIESSTGYNPAPPFELKVYSQAKENSSAPGSTDMLFMHSSTDKPGYSIDEGGNNWQNTLYNGDLSTTYITKPSNDNIITLKDASDPNDTLRFNAALQTLGYSYKAITILGCGFKNPVNNGSGLPFGLYVAVPEGGPLFPLAVVPPEPIKVESVSQEQSINIFPNPATDNVKISGGRVLYNSDISFYTAFGTMVKRVPYTGDDIFIGDLSSGVYFIQISNAGSNPVQKLKLIKL